MTNTPHRIDGLVAAGLSARWPAAAAFFALPWAAMQVTPEVRWDATDFLVWGVMIAGTMAGLELALRSSRDWAHRLGALVALGTGFLLVWVSLAVGIIGSEDNPFNLLYVGVLLTALIGGLLVRVRSAGMSRVMCATATAQAMAGVAGFLAEAGRDSAAWPRDVVGATGLFALLWLFAAALFLAAARREQARKSST